ncbi:MAG: PD-(D/E)XK nuclease family protein [Bacteroidaceae bacterium]|nr:PD-(D/E)XK nuclease family protein [Bacteroidaceae bacterium]
MQSFLDTVAKDLFGKFCRKNSKVDFAGLTKITVVFPNRRAAGFFNMSLSGCCQTPFFSPNYSTIQDLFNSLTDLHVADDIQLVCLLHQVYTKILDSTESLDSFWQWGEILLADFDEIDSQMVPAKDLFQNIGAIKEQSDNSFLTPEQINALKAFFAGFETQETQETQEIQLKKRFVTVWNKLFEIYTEFKHQLQERKLGYPGMIKRQVIQNLKDRTLDVNNDTTYVFVGFNRLDKTETYLFEYLKTNREALVYTDDFDTKHESLPKIKIISTVSDYAQACYVNTWLKELGQNNIDTPDTAVVLCKSEMLQHVLHALPADANFNTNITMGYPLGQTNVYSFVHALLELQSNYVEKNKSFRPRNEMEVRSHPFVQEKVASAGTETLTPLWEYCTNPVQLLKWLLDMIEIFAPASNALESESMYRLYTHISRFHKLMEEAEYGLEKIQIPTLIRLLQRSLLSTTVPFHGDPIRGLQVMGMIETRNLDFKNVLLLSAEEDNLPGYFEKPSFIPFNLRRAFGMHTFIDSGKIAEYNFKHLLSRCENVTILYNSNTNGTASGQPSRFLLDLMVNSSNTIEHFAVQSELKLSEKFVPVYKRTSQISKDLCQKYSNIELSPSALKTYVECPLKFYYKYIENIKEPARKDDEIDAALSGEIFHKSMELIYGNLTAGGKNVIEKERIQSVLNNPEKLDNTVASAIIDCCFENKENKDLTGLLFIEKAKITRLVMRQLKKDASYAPFTYLESEAEHYCEISVPDPLNPDACVKIKLGGIIDRLDLKDGIVRIVDYKTGTSGKVAMPKSFEDDYINSQKKDNNKWGNVFQVCYYAWVLLQSKAFPKYKLAPMLCYPLGNETESYIVNDFADYAANFEDTLRSLINNILSTNGDVTLCSDISKCKFCKYAPLCNRN